MFPKKFSAIAAIHGEDPLITLKCTGMLKRTLGAALFYIKMLFYIYVLQVSSGAQKPFLDTIIREKLLLLLSLY